MTTSTLPTPPDEATPTDSAPPTAFPMRPPRRGLRLRALADDRGQATAEYGLVVLVAGLIALGVIAWARETGTFTSLFESIVNQLTSAV
jgi:Flp pilus assembly pilin Flp